MKAVLYARVSTEKQSEKDLSISAQLKALRKFAADKGYGVVREFVDEAESARTANRPAFQQMIALAKIKPKEFDVILVYKLSRFARNREDSIIYKSLLRKRGIQVASINERVDDSPAGALFEGMIEVIDEFYSANLAQDTKRGLKENAQRGFCNGGQPPYGYKHVTFRDGSATRRKLEVDSETAPVVGRIFDECSAGRGAKQIAQRLNQQKVFNRTGKPWSKMTILRVLKNPTYAGRYVYAWYRDLRPGEDRFVVGNVCEAIVTSEQSEQVQNLIKQRTPRNNHPRRLTSDYMLSGLLRCGLCGRAMQGGTAKSGKYRYYGCYNHLRKGKSVCNAKMLNAEALERSMVAKLKERVLTPENLQALLKLSNADLKKRGGKIGKEIGVFEKQVQLKQTKLDRLYAALENGELTLGDLSPRIKKLRGEVDELNESISTARLQQSSAKTLKILPLKELKRYVADLYDLLAEGVVFERKAFLASFIKDLSVNYPEISVTYTVPLIRKPPNKSEVLSLVTKMADLTLRVYKISVIAKSH